MFKLDHNVTKYVYTLLALVATVSTISVNIALYGAEVKSLKGDLEEHKIAHEKLNERLLYLESQSRAKNTMDKYQNARLDKHEKALYEPKDR